MSSVGPIVGSAISSLMIAVPSPQRSSSVANAQLQATLNRISMQLYFKAHMESPPTATDLGGGLYNILV